jgi:hypothetical protein
MKGVTSVTVSVPLTIRRRGGRKQIIGPDGAVARQGGDGAGVVPVRGDPALIKALARGFRWRRMLEEGRYASISELAKAEKIERGYLGSLLRLTLLAPDMVEAILDGRQPEGGTAGAEGLPTTLSDAWQRHPGRRTFTDCASSWARSASRPWISSSFKPCRSTGRQACSSYWPFERPASKSRNNPVSSVLLKACRLPSSK